MCGEQRLGSPTALRKPPTRRKRANKEKSKTSKNAGPGGLDEAGRLQTQKTEHPSCLEMTPPPHTPPQPKALGVRLGWGTTSKDGGGHPVRRQAGAGQTQSKGAIPRHHQGKSSVSPLAPHWNSPPQTGTCLATNRTLLTSQQGEERSS